MGDEELEPLRLGTGVLGRDNLYFVAGFEDVVQLDQFLVYLGGDGLVAYLGVDEVCEVQRGGAFLDAALFPARGEDVDLGGGEVVVDDVEELQRIDVRVYQDFLDAVEPVVHLVVSLSHHAVLLVHPVGGDAFLGDVVHAAGADLDFHPDARVAQEGAVQCFVAVGLGVLHPVPQALRHVAVDARDDGEDVVALVSLAFLGTRVGVKDDADGVEVVDLVEGHALGLHLAPGRVRGLDAFFELVVEPGGIEGLGDGLDKRGHLRSFAGYLASGSL